MSQLYMQSGTGIATGRHFLYSGATALIVRFFGFLTFGAGLIVLVRTSFASLIRLSLLLLLQHQFAGLGKRDFAWLFSVRLLVFFCHGNYHLCPGISGLDNFGFPPHSIIYATLLPVLK